MSATDTTIREISIQNETAIGANSGTATPAVCPTPKDIRITVKAGILFSGNNIPTSAIYKDKS